MNRSCAFRTVLTMRFTPTLRVVVATAVAAAAILPLSSGSASAVGASSPSPLALIAAGCVESFNGLTSAGTAASLPPGVAFDEGLGSSARNDGLYTETDGSGNAGDVYSLGAVGATERAFGSLRSGTLQPTLGVVVRNDTGAAITSLGVTYTLEQWRQGGGARFDGLNVDYSTSTTALLGGVYTPVAALNGSAPNGGPTAAALTFNGNLAANRVTKSATISGLSIPVGGTILLRWNDIDAAGSDDALGIDDLALVANGGAAPSAACSSGGATPAPTLTPIHDIQGAAAVSPLNGQTRTIEGIVTGLDNLVGSSFGTGNNINTFPADRGFFVQEETADADTNPATSEGIFVGLPSLSTPLPAVGDTVRLTGPVKDSQFAPSFGQTRMETSSYTIVSSVNPLPPAVTLDLALANAQAVGSENNASRAYYETFEGMRVTLPSGVAQSGGTNKFGELFLVPGTATGTLLRTDPVQPGLIGTAIDAGAGNPPNPYDPPARSTTYIEANKNDTVVGLTGPLAYSFGNYKVMTQVGAMPTVNATGVTAPFSLPAASAAQRRIVSFNLENFFPVGGALDGHIIDQAEFELKRDQAAIAIGDLLDAPDVLAVQEIGDNNHLGQNGGTTSLATLQSLAARLGELGYGTYTAHMLEGNDTRGIDSGFLVKSTVAVIGTADQRGGLTAAGTCSDVAGRLFDRPPLFLEVDLGPTIGTTWVVSNHFSSKSAPDSCRVAQATWLRDQVKALELAGDEVIVTGDLNAFEDEGALAVLQDGQTTLTNLWSTVPNKGAYSFQFNGVLQTLDHLLVTDGIGARVEGFTYAHLDNDYFQSLTQPSGSKVSDHDPPTLTLGAGAPTPVVPEAPHVWMLGASALGALALGWTFLVRNKREATVRTAR